MTDTNVKTDRMASTKTNSDAKNFFWFSVSGWIGTALFYVAYELSYQFLTDALVWNFLYTNVSNAASYAWIGSYALSIIWQHALHRYLVFGPEGEYWKSLLWTYISYSFSLVLSSILNHALVEYIGVHHRIAFGATLAGTGVINYFTLKKAFAPQGKQS